MKKTAILLAGLALTTGLAVAADNPVETRQAIMDSNGAAAGLSGAMMKGDVDYSPAAGKSAIESFHASAMAFGAFFPEDSKDADGTKASPKIWSDPQAFQKALDDWKQDTQAALKISGKDGPQDLQAFQKAVQPILQNCKSCHQDFRLSN
ncbi:c-type cytochrome [Pararhizobium mangrovi]|uniref:Cytochrome c n=1 Tax=Pararhizobium mangrovi TaxID=2590452 RepID=A0A506U297_9HYPH|nr:cytochrome c [Pararhizobium mangrovi]TPW27588.1 cytochrome c [Pararhizobium mangrovi]